MTFGSRRRDRLATGILLVSAVSVFFMPRAVAQEYEASGTILFMTADQTGVVGGLTRADFERSCSFPPDSDGFDAVVFEIPPSLGKGTAAASVTGSAPVLYDLDLYFYDEDCTLLDSVATNDPDEIDAPVPASTAYILVENFRGGDVEATLRVIGPGGGPGATSPTPTTGAEPTPTPTPTPAPRSQLTTSITSDKTETDYNETFTLSGRVRAEDSTCVGPYSVTLRKRVFGTGQFKVIDPDVPVDLSNEWSRDVKSATSASYIATVSGSNCTPGTSPPLDVLVHAGIEALKPLPCRAPATLTGRVNPNHKGTEVLFQKQLAKRWKPVDRDELDRHSNYVLRVPSCDGKFRVVWPAQNVRNLKAVLALKFRG